MAQKPEILNIVPDEGLVRDEMVPEGEFADLDIMEERLIESGFPAGLIGDLKKAMKASPELRADFEHEVRKMMAYNKGEDVSSYNNPNEPLDYSQLKSPGGPKRG